MRRSNLFSTVSFIAILLLGSIIQVKGAPTGIETWTSNGPNGGVILTLAIDPETPGTMYTSTEDGGVFKKHRRRRELE